MSVKLFENENLNVNLTTIVCGNGSVYFKAKDVAEALGYSDPNGAIQKHVWNKNKFEWCNVNGGVAKLATPLESLGIQPKTLILTEPGVYQLIFSPKLPSAENFQDWVFSEILPSIRKTGSYSTNDTPAIEGTVLEKLESINIEDVPKYDSDDADDENRIKVNTKAKKIVEKSKNIKMSELGKMGNDKLKSIRRKQKERLLELELTNEEHEEIRKKQMEKIVGLELEIKKLRET